MKVRDLVNDHMERHPASDDANIIYVPKEGLTITLEAWDDFFKVSTVELWKDCGETGVSMVLDDNVTEDVTLDQDFNFNVWTPMRNQA